MRVSAEEFNQRQQELDLLELHTQQQSAMLATLAAAAASMPHAAPPAPAPKPSVPAVAAGILRGQDVQLEFGLTEAQLAALNGEGLPRARFELTHLGMPVRFELYERSAVHAWLLSRPGELPKASATSGQQSPPAPTPATKQRQPPAPTPATKQRQPPAPPAEESTMTDPIRTELDAIRRELTPLVGLPETAENRAKVARLQKRIDAIAAQMRDSEPSAATPTIPDADRDALDRAFGATTPAPVMQRTAPHQLTAGTVVSIGNGTRH